MDLVRTHHGPNGTGRGGRTAASSSTSYGTTPPALRWALFEAALCASRSGSPDRDYYRQTAERAGATSAGLAVARKLLKRSYHTLRELGEEALQPA